MSDDAFKTRMRQRSGVVHVPSPGATPPPPPTPLPAAPSGLQMLFAPAGAAVQRPMTEAERQAVSQGQSPTSNLSDSEKRQLLKMGWTDGQPVPPNIASIFASHVAEYKAAAVPIGNFPPELEVHSIDDLPPQEQERMRSAIQEAIQVMQNVPAQSMLSSYPSGVAAAMLNDSLEEVAIPGWKSEPSPETPSVPLSSEPDVPSPSKPAAPPSGKVCVHCGGDPFEDMSKTPVSNEDKQQFLIAIGTGRQFEKEYLLFNSTVRVRFRTLRSGEYDLVSMWAAKKTDEEMRHVRVDIDSFLSVMQRYQRLAVAALQTVRVETARQSGGLFWAAPDGNQPGLKDWQADGITTLDQLVEKFSEAMGSEAMVAAIQDRLGAFSFLDSRLMKAANDTENFWQGI